IQADPAIIAHPVSLNRAPKATSFDIFTVQAVGTGPLLYQWTNDTVPLVNAGHVSGPTSSTLMITPVANTDGGIYSVSVRNDVGTAQSLLATLTVSDPAVTQGPINHYEVPGATVGFSVTSAATSPPNYQWQRNSAPIQN